MPEGGNPIEIQSPGENRRFLYCTVKLSDLVEDEMEIGSGGLREILRPNNHL